jgi:outer membrane autotransporter protein
MDSLAVNLNSTMQSAIRWNAIDSYTGRLGLRIGTSFMANEYLVIAPYISGSIWREFAGYAVSSHNIGAGTDVSVSTNRIGTFEQISAGFAFSSTTPGLTGYVRGDLRFGDRIHGYAANGGLRYQF